METEHPKVTLIISRGIDDLGKRILCGKIAEGKLECEKKEDCFVYCFWREREARMSHESEI